MPAEPYAAHFQVYKASQDVFISTNNLLNIYYQKNTFMGFWGFGVLGL